MFYNAKPYIFEIAKRLRKNMTGPEQLLWEKLKDKKLLGLRFRPQHPMDIFIADFYCHALKLVIEVDGGIHKSETQREYDLGREGELEKWDIKVIRFTNEEVENNIDYVINIIEKSCLNINPGLLKSPLQGI